MKYEEEIRLVIDLVLAETGFKITEPIKVDTKLNEIGVTSLAFISIIIGIEDKFNIEFPQEFLIMDYAGTIAQLCEITGEELGS